jgi:hypothetical protein
MIKPENDLPHMESGKLILLLFAKIWIYYFIFRIKNFEVDKSPPGLLLDWLITNKQDPPTYRGGKREESGCETCAVKCIVHPHTTEGRFRISEVGQRFRHSLYLHPRFFHAVVNIIQLMIQNGEPLFPVDF